MWDLPPLPGTSLIRPNGGSNRGPNKTRGGDSGAARRTRPGWLKRRLVRWSMCECHTAAFASPQANSRCGGEAWGSSGSGAVGAGLARRGRAHYEGRHGDQEGVHGCRRADGRRSRTMRLCRPRCRAAGAASSVSLTSMKETPPPGRTTATTAAAAGITACSPARGRAESAG